MSDGTPAPEYLEPAAGSPLPGEGRSRKRPLLLGGAAVAGVALVGAAAWGAWWWLGDGGQAAEALPSSAVGYVGLTLDPSGSQKVEALSTLRSLPAIAEELDLDGPVEDIDLKQTLGTAFLGTAPCDDLTYAEHLEPWLGDRLGVAVVPVDDQPKVVLAVEAADEDAAVEGMDALMACGDDDTGDDVEGAAYQVRDGWVVLAPDETALDAVLADLDEGTLADDEDFQRWTGEAGEPGVLTMYAAPAAADYLQDALDGFFGDLGEPLLEDSISDPTALTTSASTVTATSEQPSPEEQLEEAIEAFEGAAATVRFVDGSMELEMAGGLGDSELLAAADAEDTGDASSLVTELPAGTVLAAATGLSPEGLEELEGELGADADDMVEGLLGPLDLDPVALLGDAVGLAVGPDLDVEGLVAGTTTELPVALLTTGELAAAQDVAEGLGLGLAAFLGVEPAVLGEDGRVVLGLDEAWAEEVAAADGSLGEDERFQRAVPDADDVDGLLFLDADALVDLVRGSLPEGEDDAVLDNLEPLQALGLSASTEDGTSRLVLRVTTDD
ncbi:MAG: DUF3352 domain-containing protein [Nocardioides sp.]